MRKYNVKTELTEQGGGMVSGLGDTITPIEEEPTSTKKNKRNKQITSHYDTQLIDLDRHSHIEFEQDGDKVISLANHLYKYSQLCYSSCFFNLSTISDSLSLKN